MKIEDVIDELKLEFYKIQCRNWIKSKYNGTGAAGETLEYLLGKKLDKDILPDYKGIELKTRLETSKTRLHLFSCALDNEPNQMQKLLDLVGYPSKSDKTRKLFNVSVDAIHIKRISYNYLSLKVDYLNKLLLLIIKNPKEGTINTFSWTLEELKRRLEHKLSYLALISAKSYNYNVEVYFKYKDIKFYKLKSFNEFLDLIDKGTIVVTFKIGYSKRARDYGTYLDHGTTFSIDYDLVSNLFDSI